MCILIKGLPQPNNWFIILLSPLHCFCPSPLVLVIPFLHITHPCPNASVLCVLCCLLYAPQRGLVHSKASQSGFFDFAVCADVTAHVYEELVSVLPQGPQISISSSSRLGTRKPNVPFSSFAVSATLNTLGVFCIS